LKEKSFQIELGRVHSSRETWRNILETSISRIDICSWEEYGKLFDCSCISK